MSFDPSNCSLKIQDSIGTPTPKVGVPKWESTWECVGSFPHTLLHPQDCECDSQVTLSARTFPCPCLGCEPKVKVVTRKGSQHLYHAPKTLT
jgi:hypothetical protein